MRFGTEKGLPRPNQAAKFSTQKAWPLHQCCQCINAGWVPWGWWSTWLGISTAPLGSPWSGLLNKATCPIARSCRAFRGKSLESPHLTFQLRCGVSQTRHSKTCHDSWVRTYCDCIGKEQKPRFSPFLRADVSLQTTGDYPPQFQQRTSVWKTPTYFLWKTRTIPNRKENLDLPQYKKKKGKKIKVFMIKAPPKFIKLQSCKF